MSKVHIRTADQPVRRVILPAAALSLCAALVMGIGVANAQADSFDGTWAVDTERGELADGTSTFVGFRVNEILDPGGEVTAVGRTPDVSGQLEMAGTVIESFVLEADLTTLATDNNFRNGAIQRTLDTGEFPTAVFASTEPVDLGEIPAEGEAIEVSVPGTLTVKDVSQDIVVDMQAGHGGGTIVATGLWPIDFTDFEITMPTAPIVVAVEDNGLLEWQVFFTSEGDMADDEMAEDDEMADEDMAEDEASEE